VAFEPSEKETAFTWAETTLLGTNVSQLGFSSTWTRVAPGYGTEFQLRVLWGYRRTITLAMDSSEFRRTDVKSNIEYEVESDQP